MVKNLFLVYTEEFLKYLLMLKTTPPKSPGKCRQSIKIFIWVAMLLCSFNTVSSFKAKYLSIPEISAYIQLS